MFGGIGLFCCCFSSLPKTTHKERREKRITAVRSFLSERKGRKEMVMAEECPLEPENKGERMRTGEQKGTDYGERGIGSNTY